MKNNTRLIRELIFAFLAFSMMKAQALFEQAVKLDPESPDAHLGMDYPGIIGASVLQASIIHINFADSVMLIEKKSIG
jgi:hypothetical protein